MGAAREVTHDGRSSVLAIADHVWSGVKEVHFVYGDTGDNSTRITLQRDMPGSIGRRRPGASGLHALLADQDGQCGGGERDR